MARTIIVPLAALVLSSVMGASVGERSPSFAVARALRSEVRGSAKGGKTWLCS